MAYKPWWEDELEHLDEEIDSSPVSNSWRSKLGSWSSDNGRFSVGASEKTQRLEGAQTKLIRSANVVLNSNEKGKERSLNIGFSDGKKTNSPMDDEVWISPDAFLSTASGTEDEGLAIDALTGQVLMASAMKRTVSTKAWKQATESRDPFAPVANIIWRAMEQAAARSEVLTDWEGFAPYFKRHQDTTSASKGSLEEIIKNTEEQPKLKLAATALAWNILNPKNKLDLPSNYNEAVEEAMTELAKRKPRGYERYEASEQLTKILMRLDDTPPEPSGSGGEGEGDGGGGESGKSNPSEEPPSVSDGSLFGDKVECEEEHAKELPQSSSTEREDVDGESSTVHMPEGAAKISGTRVTVAIEKDSSRYMECVRHMNPQINAIINALRFRNNELSMFNRGVSSGDLDEGSLDKLSLNENNPAIWERRELIGQPKIAVGLLLDESGSMGKGSKIRSARNVCIALTAALSKIKGVSIMVLGHTANQVPDMSCHSQTSGAGHLSMIEYYTRQSPTPYAIVHADARGNNLDGHAMEYAARKMMKDYPEFPRRLLFVISDGQPAGWGVSSALGSNYGGKPAMQHMRRVCEFGRRNRVGIYGIGICEAYGHAEGREMYGDGNFVVLHDVMSSLPVLKSFLRQIAVRPV